MKIKVFVSLILITFSIFIIYIFNIDTKVYYFNIMDNKYNYNTYNVLLKNNINNLEKYVNIENDNDYRITDLIRDINDNIEIDKKTLQNVLIKADVITLKIGENELEYKLKNTNLNEIYDYIDEFLRDMDNLLKLIRKYSKEKIFMIGFYNYNEYYDEIYAYINVRMRDLCDEYNINYIELNDEFDEQMNVNIYTKIIKNI